MTNTTARSTRPRPKAPETEMSEENMDTFMGKDKSAATLPPGMPTMTTEQFTQLLAAVSNGRATPKTEAQIKADADANAMAQAAPNINMNDRVWITLSDNKNIARGGQFFGVNGASFLLKPGK